MFELSKWLYVKSKVSHECLSNLRLSEWTHLLFALL